MIVLPLFSFTIWYYILIRLYLIRINYHVLFNFFKNIFIDMNGLIVTRQTFYEAIKKRKYHNQSQSSVERENQ